MMNNQDNIKNFINNMNKNKTKPCTDPRHFPPPLYVSITAWF